MHEDPTRRMDAPPPPAAPPPPPPEGMSSGAKVMIGILVAAVLGLGVALAIVASDSGDDEQATVPETSLPTTTPTTTTAPTTTTTTAPTTTTEPTETTTTEPATTTETTTETDGSGGISPAN